MLIGDAARYTGVSVRMLRHYDAVGLVRPTGRTIGGYRDYSDDDVRTILQVKTLRSLGLTLKQIGRILEDPGRAPAALVGDLVRQTEERLDRERELLDRLRTIAASKPADWQEAVRIVKLVRGLGSASASRRQQAVLSWPADAAPPVDLLVRAVLSEPDPNVAGALQWALARSDGDVVAELRTGAQSDDVDIRRRAIITIAAMPEAPGADVVLVGALGDSDVTARKHAALALGRVGEAAAVPALVDMAAVGVSDVEATEAWESLSRIPACARAVCRLELQLREMGSHPGVRERRRSRRSGQDEGCGGRFGGAGAPCRGAGELRRAWHGRSR